MVALGAPRDATLPLSPAAWTMAPAFGWPPTVDPLALVPLPCATIVQPKRWLNAAIVAVATAVTLTEPMAPLAPTPTLVAVLADAVAAPTPVLWPVAVVVDVCNTGSAEPLAPKASAAPSAAVVLAAEATADPARAVVPVALVPLPADAVPLPACPLAPSALVALVAALGDAVPLRAVAPVPDVALLAVVGFDVPKRWEVPVLVADEACAAAAELVPTFAPVEEELLE